SFIEFFIINFSSGLLSLTISFLFFNFVVLLVYLIKIPVTIPLIIIISALSITLLFYLFFLTVSLLSKHFMGYFDHESFFIFKHWPMKIFNVNWQKKWTLLKYPAVVIVIGLIVCTILFSLLAEKTNQQNNNSQFTLKEHLRQQIQDNCIIGYSEDIFTCSPFNQEQLELKYVQEVETARKDLWLDVESKTLPRTTIFNFFDATIERLSYLLKYGMEWAFQREQWNIIKELSPAEQQLLFYDNFENSLSQWRSQDLVYNPYGGFWHIEEEQNNKALEGFEHIWVHAGSEDFKTSIFETKFKILDGGAHINFINRDYPGEGRYYVSVAENHLGLHRQYDNWEIFEELESVSINLKKGEWYDLRIELNESNDKYITIFLNDKIVLSNPHVPIYNTGSIAFETLDNSVIWFDDVKVFGNYQDEQQALEYNVFEKTDDELTKYIEEKEKNIAVSYQQSFASERNQEFDILGYQEQNAYRYKYIFSFFDSYDYLSGRLIYLEKLKQEIVKVLDDYYKNKINVIYNNRNVEESLQSKAIRLTVMERFLENAR
ncbi:MAG: DUF1080 domain-containing protein, partial [Nanoarchaeota archaeon]|nr:DUF1080 domain-containing protein [Nanoarchaeota archaeon]